MITDPNLARIELNVRNHPEVELSKDDAMALAWSKYLPEADTRAARRLKATLPPIPCISLNRLFDESAQDKTDRLARNDNTMRFFQRHFSGRRECYIDAFFPHEQWPKKSPEKPKRRGHTGHKKQYRGRPKTYELPKTPIAPNGAFFEEHKDCYLKEARAMIEGKHWEGKNRCVKLPGDE